MSVAIYNKYGGHRQRERVAALAEWCLKLHEGDIVEIGACQGLCSKLLAKAAAKYHRKLIVIDPWISGTQNCRGGEFEDFLRNVSEFNEYIEVIRESSMSAKVFDHLRNRPIAFAFVDGLHNFKACWSDFNLVRSTSGLIVADDVRYNMEVLMAARI